MGNQESKGIFGDEGAPGNLGNGFLFDRPKDKGRGKIVLVNKMDMNFLGVLGVLG